MRLNRAFTLIELLLVISMVSIISSVAAVFMGRFVVYNATDNAVDQIVGQLRKAQAYSMVGRKSNSTGWGVRYSPFQLTLYLGASYATRVAALDENVQMNSNLNITNFEINFSRVTGTPSATPSISITGNQGTSKTINLNSLGVVSR